MSVSNQSYEYKITPMTCRPTSVALQHMQNLAYRVGALTFQSPYWENVANAGWDFGLSLGCRMNMTLRGDYTVLPDVSLNSTSLLLLSPDVDLVTSYCGSFGSWFSIIGDCLQKDGGPCNALQILGYILMAIAAIVLYGASMVQSVMSAVKICRLNRSIRVLNKQVKDQQQLLVSAARVSSSHSHTDISLSTRKFSDSMALQANKHLSLACRSYRTILITNLVEKILFTLLITSVICFIILASVFGVTALPCMVMGGCAAGFTAAILALALASCIYLRKQVGECLAHVRKAWLYIMTSELIVRAPEAMRRNVSARMLVLQRFIEERGQGESRTLNSLDLKILMARIGFSGLATTSNDGSEIDEDTLQRNLMNPEPFFT